MTNHRLMLSFWGAFDGIKRMEKQMNANEIIYAHSRAKDLTKDHFSMIKKK